MPLSRKHFKIIKCKNVVTIHELPLHFLCHTQLKIVLQPIEALTNTNKLMKLPQSGILINLSGFSAMSKL
jgi:hypothetical protein